MTSLFAFFFQNQNFDDIKNNQFRFNTFCRFYGFETRLEYAYRKTRNAGDVRQMEF